MSNLDSPADFFHPDFFPPPSYIRDELRDDLAASMVEAWAASLVIRDRRRIAEMCAASAAMWWAAWDRSADPMDQGRALEAEELAAAIGPRL